LDSSGFEPEASRALEFPEAFFPQEKRLCKADDLPV